MNERIKELWIEGTQTSIPREGDYSSVSAKNIEKFAELIALECAELMEQQHTWISNVAASNVIRKHFGVEE